MKNPLPLRTAPLLAAGALALASLAVAVPSAHAAPVFTLANMDTSGYAHDDATCVLSNQVEPAPVNDTPVTENGPATTVSTSASVTTTAADPTDIMNGSASVTASGSVSSVGTNLKSIDVVGQGSVNVTSTKALSACDLHIGATSTLDFDFTVTTPGFLTVKVARKPHMYTEFYIEMLSPTNTSYFQQYGEGLSFDSNTKIYLPAGTYSGYATLEAGVDDQSVATQSFPVGSVHATFAAAGSQTEAVKGKGKKYVKFPTARSCATDQLIPSITGKRKSADKIQQVKFFVNDKKVKKVRNPDKGDDIKLSVADDVVADVRAEVKLFPAAKGKPGKVLEVTAAYEACSG